MLARPGSATTHGEQQEIKDEKFKLTMLFGTQSTQNNGQGSGKTDSCTSTAGSSGESVKRKHWHGRSRRETWRD
jgi:hypothetical protein